MPKNTIEPTYASIANTAKARGLTRDQIYKLIHAGEIEAAKVGRATLIKLATVDAYLERKRITQFVLADSMRALRKRKAERMRRTSHSLANGDST
jgi:excisionase family DNA binding protein